MCWVMAEYIEREAAQNVAERYGCTNGATLGIHSGLADRIASEIEALPAADVAPVRHGKWIKRKCWDFHVCSECSFETSPSKYCPNCGADMRGGDERCLE